MILKKFYFFREGKNISTHTSTANPRRAHKEICLAELKSYIKCETFFCDRIKDKREKKQQKTPNLESEEFCRLVCDNNSRKVI